MKKWNAARIWALMGMMLLPVGAAAQAVEAERGVSLRTLLDHADAHAPMLRSVQAQRELTRREQGAASVLLPQNPRLQVAAGARYDGNGAHDLTVQAMLMQPVEIAGQRGLRADVARSASERRQAQVIATRWELHRRIRTAFAQAVVARQQEALAGELVESQQELARIAEARVALGDASPLAVRLAVVEVANARQVLLSVQQRVRSLGFELAELTGWPQPTVRASTLNLEGPRSLPPAGHLLALAREHQADLVVRMRRVQEAQARLDLARRDAWPEPGIGVRAVREGAPGGGPSEWFIVGIASVPLPFWERNQEAVGQAIGQLAVAEAEHRSLTATLESSVRRVATRVETAGARVQIYDSEIVPQFADNLEMLRRSFEIGEIDFIAVSAARERLYTARLEALRVHAEYHAALGELEVLLGADPWTGASPRTGDGER